MIKTIADTLPSVVPPELFYRPDGATKAFWGGTSKRKPITEFQLFHFSVI